MHHGGSIPAPAGEPLVNLDDDEPKPVYPRACGGTVLPMASATGVPGLSPRLRGNRYGVPPEGLIARSIPAPAGEPMIRWMSGSMVMVYPRACGGTRAKNGHHKGQVRSIPAPAGEPC